MGHLLTADGLKPDRQKVQAILDMPKPTDVSGIVSSIEAVDPQRQCMGVDTRA